MFLAVSFSVSGLMLLQAVYHGTLTLDFLESTSVRDVIICLNLINMGVIFGLCAYLMYYPPVKRIALFAFYSLFALFCVGIAGAVLPQVFNLEVQLVDGIKLSTSSIKVLSASSFNVLFCGFGAWYSFTQYRAESAKTNTT